MAMKEKLIREIENTSEPILSTVLDFLLFIKHKKQREISQPDERPLGETMTIRSHNAFLNGYSTEDEGLYDNY